MSQTREKPNDPIEVLDTESDAQDHLILFDLIKGSFPESSQLDLVEVCNAVAAYIKDERHKAAHLARLDEVGRLLSQIDEGYPAVDSASSFRELKSRWVVSDRYNALNRTSHAIIEHQIAA
jgi:hypothetical protein